LIGWRGGCGHGALGKLGVSLNIFLEGKYDSLIFQIGIYGSFTYDFIVGPHFRSTSTIMAVS
jgi:hypothetical protein